MIRRTTLFILANIAALYIIVEFVNVGFEITGGVKGYLIAAITIGFLNSMVKPILKLMSFPLMFATAGIFTIVINTFLIWFAKYALGVIQFEGVELIINGGFGTYIGVAIIISIANMVIHWLLKK